MKKIFLVLSAVVMTAISVSAQDLATATETFNNGAMELQMGNMEAALTNFQSALEMAEALGEQGAEIATNCKGAIPQVMFSIAKGLIKDENYEGALAQLDATIAAANKYESADVAAEAADVEAASGHRPSVHHGIVDHIVGEIAGSILAAAILHAVTHEIQVLLQIDIERRNRPCRLRHLWLLLHIQHTIILIQQDHAIALQTLDARLMVAHDA